MLIFKKLLCNNLLISGVQNDFHVHVKDIEIDEGCRQAVNYLFKNSFRTYFHATARIDLKFVATAVNVIETNCHIFLNKK